MGTEGDLLVWHWRCSIVAARLGDSMATPVVIGDPGYRGAVIHGGGRLGGVGDGGLGPNAEQLGANWRTFQSAACTCVLR